MSAAERHLSRSQLAAILEAARVTDLDVAALMAGFRREPDLSRHLPDAATRLDPRDGARVIYTPDRAGRPHDNAPLAPATAASPDRCPICRGRTTGVVDVANLSHGFTFINKNLFPVLHLPPAERPSPAGPPGDGPGRDSRYAHPDRLYGLHFLQWTSSYHEDDWHNLPVADGVVVMSRLAALEQQLLLGAGNPLPVATGWSNREGVRGYVTIMKNYGRAVGGSLAHGHQQIGYSNLMPPRFGQNARFRARYGESFARHLLRHTPETLHVRDYGPALLLVPGCMRRPYQQILLLKNTARRYLHQLDAAELSAVAAAWGDVIRALRAIMPALGRPVAYNILTHSGPGAGLYFEFLPYTQETGGFEHLGFWVCLARPEAVAHRLRQQLADPGA